MKITLAIPNYNGLENLKILIPEVLKEGFEQIYVLDDKSTDNSINYLTEHFPQIKIVKGEVNLGPAGNRNRILKEEIGDIILFLDADMLLKSHSLIKAIKNLFADSQKTLIGGQIFTKIGAPMLWNWGYQMNLLKDATGMIIFSFALKLQQNKKVRNFFIKTFSGLTPNLEINFQKAQERKVDWVSEAVFCVRSSTFKSVGGFDPKMRYHADQDLCKRLRDKNYTIYFSPQIQVNHQEIDTFGKKRNWQIFKYTLYFLKKHYFQFSS